MIPNPRKAVTIDFSEQELKDAVERIPGYFNNKYQLVEANSVFNQYTFGATEFLSAGVFMDVNLSSVSEKRTEVSIEVRRKIGAFDQWHEVQHANTHISNFTNALTALLMCKLPQDQVRGIVETHNTPELWDNEKEQMDGSADRSDAARA